MNASEYKNYHESFMQNNTGSTAIHTFFCIFFTVQCTIYISISPKLPSLLHQYIYEYIVIVLPMILAHTVLADYIYWLNLIAFVILLYKLLFYCGNASKKFMQISLIQNDRIALISCLRGLTYLITVFCILAVDFKIFPRYLAKTERFGYSLMDTGVGLFVIVSGLVYKDVRKQSFREIIGGNIKIISILLILGIGRFISVKLLNYQEHVSEYGVHWNFFFTLAICKTIATILLCLSNHPFLLCGLVTCFHEITLLVFLQDWVFGDSPRNSLISANREGISSCLGYVSIYLFGVHIKNILLNQNVTKYVTQKKLVFETILLWIMTYFMDFMCLTSRTVANIGYCLYIYTILTTITAVFYFVTVLFEEKEKCFHVPIILSYINTNGLSFFLISNLLTGAINLSIRTLFVSKHDSFAILNVYMIVNLTILVFLNKCGLRI